MALDWDHLRVFLAVARTGQLLAAGRRLRLDHATVGRRIDALERSVGGKLLERRTTGSTLTGLGERLLLTAEQMESSLSEALSDLSRTEATISGTVRVGAPDGLGTYFLVSRLAELALLYPDLTIELVPLTRTFSLSRREADMAIAIERPGEGRLTVRKLADYSLSAYASRRHLETAGPIETLADLADRILITYVQDLMYSPALDYGGELERATRRRFACASVAAQLEAVRAGAGVGILHDYAAAQTSGLVRVLPVFSVERSYWLVAHTNQRSLRRIAVVHDFIIDQARRAGRAFFCPSLPYPA
jgi:DNA-binding transcriptional LysR family regulator